MEYKILDLIDRYWKFDDNQTPVSNLHDKQDLLEAVRKALLVCDCNKWHDRMEESNNYCSTCNRRIK